MSLIQALKDDAYTYGALQSIPYDRNNTAVFKPGFLGDLYFMLQGDRFNKDRPGKGILEYLFCGMVDLSFDKIVAYLASIPLCVMGVWEGEGDERTFRVAGIHFITVKSGVGAESSCFAGYGFLKSWWGSDEQDTLTLLGIAQIFGALNVKAIHGMRYTTNGFTAAFMKRFGFTDVGTIPNYMMRRDRMVGATVSTLSREDFEDVLLRRVLAGDPK